MGTVRKLRISKDGSNLLSVQGEPINMHIKMTIYLIIAL